MKTRFWVGVRRLSLIIQRSVFGDEEQWAVIRPNGDVDFWATAQDALERAHEVARDVCHRSNRPVRVTIKWAYVPEGFVPPKRVQR